MKKAFTILMVCLSIACYGGKTYFVSSVGNGTNNGLTTSTTWNIPALNASMSLILAGDTIRFKRGDVIYGMINMTRNGTAASKITFATYGTGAQPVISGFTTLGGWTNLGGNIWSAAVPVIIDSINLVTRNNVIQQIGRYPNTNAANGGYLAYTAATTTSITGPALSTTTDWTGAEIAIRLFRWEIRRRKITNHVGGVVGFTNPMAGMLTTPSAMNRGYFFQRDPRTLDQDGEWWHDETNNQLRMYFANNNPNAYTIRTSTLDTLFYTNKSYITIDSLDFTGANSAAVMITGSSDVTVRNCKAYVNSGMGISCWFTSHNITVSNNVVDSSLSAGMRIYGNASSTNYNIISNKVNHTSLIAGMEITDMPSAGSGIFIRAFSGTNVLYNTIRNSGYNGITWYGSNLAIKYNFIDSFCMVRDDGGAIYTFTVSGPGIIYGNNRRITSNIIDHGIGNRNGAYVSDMSPSGQLAWYSSNGIYTDEGTRDVTIDSNTITNVSYQGINGNGNTNLVLRANTTFNVPISHSYQRLKDENVLDSFVIARNIFYHYRFRFRDQALNLPTPVLQNESVARMGRLDSNYYSTKSGADTSLDVQTADNPAGSSFSQNYRSFPYMIALIGIEGHSINVPNTGMLRYNASSSPVIISFLGLSYKDVYGNIYNNAVSVREWGSIILIPNGPAPSPNVAPIAVAGTDQIITAPASSVTLSSAGSSDADGTMVAFAWTKISGPAANIIVTPAQPSTIVNSLVVGVYQFELAITDNLGLVGRDTVQVTVNAVPNVAPVAGAGADKTIVLPTSTTTLDGSATDGDGTITSIAWVKLSGPVSGIIATPTAAVTSLNSLVEGVYTYKITVTDNSGATDTDTVQVTVDPAANRAPTSNAGADQTIVLPTNSTTLNGSGTDVDGTVAGYAWIKLSGPAAGTIVTPASATTVINALVQGVYQFELTVTDNDGATKTDVVRVTVDAAANQTPAANAGPDRVIKLPTNTTILNGSGTDPDGTIASYSWAKILGSGGSIGTPAGANTTVTGLSQGLYIYELTVTDNNGAIAVDRVQVTVQAANVAPVADAGPYQSFNLPTTSTVLSGSGTDSDGSISSYAWTQITGPPGAVIVTVAAASTSVNSLIEGIYNFQLTVTDNEGATHNDVVQVTVGAIPNIAPQASAGGDQFITLPTSFTFLTVTATDIDGTITAYSWRQLFGPSTAALTAATSTTTQALSLVQGIYAFEIRVTDNDGATARDTVDVTVNAAIPNNNPFANAGADVIVTLPANSTTLTGSGTDSDGTIINYEWKEGATVLSNMTVLDVTGLTVGDHVYTFTVTDNNGGTGSDVVMVRVLPVAPSSSDYIIWRGSVHQN